MEFGVGKKPETEAGVELKRLLRTFMAVKTNIGARRAEVKFMRLYDKYRAFITERIYRTDIPKIIPGQYFKA